MHGPRKLQKKNVLIWRDWRRCESAPGCLDSVNITSDAPIARAALPAPHPPRPQPHYPTPHPRPGAHAAPVRAGARGVQRFDT